MKKIFNVIAFVTILVLLLAACGGNTAPSPDKTKIALFLARGGLGDKAFNDSANEGLQKAAQELSVQVKTFDYDQINVEANIRQAAKDGYGLIIGLGSENSAAIATVAKEFPTTKFAIVDATADGTNVTAVTFSELDGDFLMGALAALMSINGKVAFLGGADVLVIRRIQFGFEQGARYVKPDIDIIAQNIGGKDDFSGFAKPDNAQEIAAQMYDDGVDIIYAAAGGSTLGAIKAAQEVGKPIITTGSDQRYLAPEVIATSRTKNMNVAVFMVIQKFVKGELDGKRSNRQLDYKSGGVGIAPFSHFVPDAVLAPFQKIRLDLEAGKITVQPYTGQ